MSAEEPLLPLPRDFDEVALEEVRRQLASRGLILGQPYELLKWPPPSWESDTNPSHLLEWLDNHPFTKRHQRLLACTLARVWLRPADDERSGRAVEVAERYADVDAYLEELRDARVHAFYASREHRTLATEAAYCVTFDEALMAARRLVECAQRAGQEALACELIRDLHRPPSAPPLAPEDVAAWRTPTTVAVAETIYRDKTFADLPILADALDDAGCTDETLLGHCRGLRRHGRGCWVLHLLRGR